MVGQSVPIWGDVAMGNVPNCRRRFMHRYWLPLGKSLETEEQAIVNVMFKKT